MNIATRLQASAVIITMVMVLLCLLFIITLHLQRQAVAAIIVADELMRRSYELNILSSSVVMHAEERSKEQWLAAYDVIARDLTKETLQKNGEQHIVNRMIASLKDIKVLYDRLEASTSGRQPADARILLLQQRQLAELIIKRSLELSQDASRLESQSHQEIVAIYNRMRLLIPLLAVILTGGTLWGALHIRRSITRPIDTLRAGVNTIHSGNFDYRVGKVSDDELGHLSTAFDDMTRWLKETTVSRNELLQEIEERTRVEEALRKSEGHLRCIYNSGLMGVFLWNMEGKILDANDKFLEMLGYSRQEMQAGLMDWTQMTPPEYIARDQFAMEELKTRGVDTPYEKQYIRKDSTCVPILIGAAMLDEQRHDGVGFVLDITDRKRSEEEREQLICQLQRSNSELQQFAYVASHDLQEPLRNVTRYVELLAHRYRDVLDDRATTYMDFAVEGARRIHLLINDLLAYVEVASSETNFHPVAMEDVVRQARQILNREISESSAIITTSPLPMVAGQDEQLTRLVVNLLGNAIKFRKDGVIPVVAISVGTSDGQWLFCINDNGIGIEPRFFDQIFTIFQRLHPREHYPGTGMGLAICRKIVQWHGGRIWVKSVPGKGSTFCFTLPGTGEERHGLSTSETD